MGEMGQVGGIGDDPVLDQRFEQPAAETEPDAAGTNTRGHRQLIAWNKAMDLAEAIYVKTQDLPAREHFGITSQIRRAAVSVPSNIAEGHGRRNDGDFRRFLDIAYGSLMEIETQIELAYRLHLLTKDDAHQLLSSSNETARLINGLKRRLKQR